MWAWPRVRGTAGDVIKKLGRPFLSSHPGTLSVLAFVMVTGWMPELQASHLHTHVQRQGDKNSAALQSLFILRKKTLSKVHQQD